MDEVACEVWTATLADLRTEHLAVVSEFERARADRFRRPDDRTRSLLGAVVLRSVAARHLDIAASDVEIDRTCTRCGGSHGRPTVAGGPSVSVSHSGDVVVVAASAVAPVGVDVEVVADLDVADVAGAAFTASERGHLSSPKDVLICWTRKEAFLKATGEGLNVPLTDLCVTAPDRPPALVERAGVPAVRCAMSDLCLRPGHVGTVAVLGADSVRVTELDAAELLARHGGSGRRFHASPLAHPRSTEPTRVP